MTDTEKRLAALESKIDSLEQQLARQSHRAQIENLMGRHQYLYAAGLGQRIVDELWAGREDVSIEYGASGIYRGLWKVETFYRKERLPGRLSTYALTTQTIEIAGDGESAQGLWIALGTETDAGELGPAPPREDQQRRFLLSSETEDGRRYRAEWLWQKYRVTFVRREDGWRILHLHIAEIFRCPFQQDWVRYATQRFATDGIWLESLFESAQPLPPQSHGENLPSASSSGHWQYTPDALPVLWPEPPEPYDTISGEQPKPTGT